MGLFGKKKKKEVDTYSDEGEGDDRGMDDGPGGGGGGGMDDMPSFQGSDDNPYAEDPAHKQLVKLLDSNGLVRHRRAFVRNDIYTVKHAKECDEERLKSVGVVLDSDRKKLLRIFRDADAMESEIDKQKEIAKEQESSKKKGKKKKDRKKKHNDDNEDLDNDDLNEEDDEEEERGKSKKKRKKKKGKSKKDRKEKDDIDDDLGDLDEDKDDDEDNGKEKSKSRSKKNGKRRKKKNDDDLDLDDENEKPRSSGKKKKRGKKKKNDDLDLDENEDDNVEVQKKEKSKKKKKPKRKKRDENKENAFKDDNDVDENEEGKDLMFPESEPEAVEVMDEGLDINRNQQPKVKEEKAEVTELDNEIKKRERKMSDGSQALRMLNERLGGGNIGRRNSILSTRSRKTIDEDEEEWWKSLDSVNSSSSSPQKRSKNRKSQRRISFSTNDDLDEDDDDDIEETELEEEESVKTPKGLSKAEKQLLKDFRRGKVPRRQQPQPQMQMPIPMYNLTPEQIAVAPPMPPQRNVPTSSSQVDPPGQSTAAASQMIPHPYTMPMYYAPPPPPPNQIQTHRVPVNNDNDIEDDEDDDKLKYKFFKEQYRRKQMKQKKKAAPAPKKRKQRVKKSREFVDVRDQVLDESRMWPWESSLEFVNDHQVNVCEDRAELEKQKFGTDDHFYNFNNAKEDNQKQSMVVAPRRRSRRKVDYFTNPSSMSLIDDGSSSDTEMYILRKSLANVGASKYYPTLIKHGVLSLKHCTMSKLEKLPLSNDHRKRSLIRACLMAKKESTRNRRDIVDEADYADLEDYDGNDSEDIEHLTMKKKGNLRRSSLTARKEHARTASRSNRHYFKPQSQHNQSQSVGRSSSSKDDAAELMLDEESSKKSVKFDLQTDDEVSLPDESDIENGSDSEMSLA